MPHRDERAHLLGEDFGLMLLEPGDADPKLKAVRRPLRLGALDQPRLLGDQPEQPAENLRAEIGSDRESGARRRRKGI